MTLQKARQVGRKMRRYGSVYLVKQNVLVYFGYNWKDRNGTMIWLLILMCFFMKGCHVSWFPYQQTWLGINEVSNNTCNFTGQNWWGQAGNSWWDLLNTNWLLGIKIVRMKFEGKVVIFLSWYNEHLDDRQIPLKWNPLNQQHWQNNRLRSLRFVAI